jgi:hypothetical protein
MKLHGTSHVDAPSLMNHPVLPSHRQPCFRAPMRSTSWLSALALLVLPASALAQVADDHRVTVEDVRVDGQPLPAALQPILAGPLDQTIEPIRACYRARTAQRPDLAGTLRLSMWVSNRQVIRVTQEASTLNDPQLERCVADAIRAYRLPDTAPAGGAQVQATVRFARSAQPVTPAGPAPTTPSGAPLDLGQVLSGLPPDVLEAPRSVLSGLPGIGQLFGGNPGTTTPPTTNTGNTTPGATPTTPGSTPIPSTPTDPRVQIEVRSSRGALEAPTVAEGLAPRSSALFACYEAARTLSPRVGNTVRLDMRIAADGTLRSVTASNGLRNRAATECVRRIAREARFAPAARATRASADVRFTAPTP